MEANVPLMPYTVHLTALIYAMEGRPADAIARLGEIDVMQFDAHLSFHLSEPYAMAGEHTAALQLLADAVERGFYPADFIVRYCPFLEPLRSRAEFQPIAARAAERAAEFQA
jgi:hypothetical protein